MLKDASYRSKKRVRVDLELENGSVLDGFVFCGQGERISDILNDQRAFLPFETHTADVMMLRKGVITNILARKENTQGKTSDPFEILGIPPTASREDIKRAYHEQVRIYHPDKLTSLDLPEDMTDYASDTLARINAAYALVMRKLDVETSHLAAD